MSNDKILDRLRKLMAIANDNAAGGEHERDTAMRMALNLLAKHNLSMADVGAADKAPPEARVKHEEVFYDYVWMRTMAAAIAKLYFCRVFTTKTGKKDRSTFTFVGLEGNVITAKEMFSYVVKSVVAEASRTTTARGENQTFKWSFCKGAAAKIHERCVQLRKEAEGTSEAERKPGTALVLANVYEQEARANDAFIQQQLGIRLVKRASSTRNTRSDGYGSGQAFGATVGLTKQVGSTTKRLK